MKLTIEKTNVQGTLTVRIKEIPQIAPLVAVHATVRFGDKFDYFFFCPKNKAEKLRVEQVTSGHDKWFCKYPGELILKIQGRENDSYYPEQFFHNENPELQNNDWKLSCLEYYVDKSYCVHRFSLPDFVAGGCHVDVEDFDVFPILEHEKFWVEIPMEEYRALKNPETTLRNRAASWIDKSSISFFEAFHGESVTVGFTVNDPQWRTRLAKWRGNKYEPRWDALHFPAPKKKATKKGKK